MSSKIQWGWVIGVLLTLVACDRAEEATTPATEPAELTEIEMVALMEGHYGSAIAGHDALIRGDLATLRRRLSEIQARSLPPTAPAAWRPFEERLRAAARRAADVPDLERAGPAMGAIAEACGACHVAVELEEIYRRPEPPQGDDALETAMLEHQWATERLWEGITGPWDEAWNRGADTLAGSRVFGVVDGTPVSEDLLARETAMQEAGRAAKTMTDLHARAMAYGRLLSTCADCHRAAGVIFGE